MPAFRSVVSVLLRELGDFSLHPQGRPCGRPLRGRPRPPTQLPDRPHRQAPGRTASPAARAHVNQLAPRREDRPRASRAASTSVGRGPRGARRPSAACRPGRRAHLAEPLLGIAHYAELRIQARQQVLSSQVLRAARKTPCRASQPEVEITEGDPMAEI